VGRSVVIHEDPDDLGMGGHADSLTTGHAGKRITCAVIGYSKKTC
jgi:Cu-Zn family superoxide dismutase